MSHVLNGMITCAMCRATFELARAKPVLASRRMKVHDVYPCPNCGYYVSVIRRVQREPAIAVH